MSSIFPFGIEMADTFSPANIRSDSAFAPPQHLQPLTLLPNDTAGQPLAHRAGATALLTGFEIDLASLVANAAIGTEPNPSATAPGRIEINETGLVIADPEAYAFDRIASDFVPTDPSYGDQWHLTAMGDLQTIWDEYTGAGVSVGVYDAGVQSDHADLAANYDASLHIEYNGTIWAGDPNDASTYAQNHGTAVAGIIAAAANGSGTVGIAHEASITSVNIFDSTSDISFVNFWGFIEALSSLNFDVMNNSWGSTSQYSADANPNENSGARYQTLAWESVAADGRGGLGTIVVNSAGNNDRISIRDGGRSSEVLIVVGAVDSGNFSSSYSSYGPSLLVSAPSNGLTGITTSDREGSAGYTSGDTMGFFGGTSAAAPMVSGVVALMLEANPELGWRDVKTIISLSADRTGSTLYADTAGRNEDGLWQFNSATNWNGGGQHFHTNYGYGEINAYNAVRMAEAWSLMFGEAATSANAELSSVAVFANTVISDAAVAELTFETTEEVTIENLQLTIDFQHANIGDLVIELVAPDGQVYVLEDGRSPVTAAFDHRWTYSVEALRGQSNLGTWTVRITDSNNTVDTDGLLRGVVAEFHGSLPTSDDVYHYTDNFFEIYEFDASRSTLSDIDGGNDWVNLSAIGEAVFVSLESGSTSYYGGLGGETLFTIAAGTVIENVVGGDGGDWISGNSSDNVLHGMRGNDVLDGMGGNDSLYGGAGNDTLYGRGSDGIILDGGTGVDTMDASAAGGYVSFYVDETDDIVVSGSGTNYLFVSAAYYEAPAGIFDITFNDASLAQTVVGTADTNHFREMQWNDTAVGGGGNDYYYLYDGRATVVEEDDGGYDRVQILTGSYDHQMADWVEEGTMFGANTLYGNAMDNVLAGQGTTTLAGGLGDDTYRIWDTTTIVEEAGEGTDTVEVYFSYTLAENFENLSYREYRYSRGDTLTGNDVGNVITGSNGNEAIYGLGGNDTLIGDVEDYSYSASYHSNDNLYGGEGDDTLYGVTGDDLLDGGTGADTMVGGVGDDTYYVDDAGDTVTELADEGTDTVYASLANYTLADNVENLTAGNTPQAYALTGNALANTITGGSQGDTIDGGVGADTMIGGTGDDTYYVDDAGDVVTELTGEGTDHVITGLANYTLAAWIENLTMTGEGALTALGNDIANIITISTTAAEGTEAYGEAGDDTLDASATTAAVSLYGGFGSDNLTGGLGNDYLHGGRDTDTMYGGDGEDELDGSWGSDYLYGGAGIDTISGSSHNDYIFGEDGDDLLNGDRGADNIRGGLGVDTINGGDGDDRLYGEDEADRISGGTGEDYILAGTGNDLVNGGWGNDFIRGQDGDDNLAGSLGDDSIGGGAGNDRIRGGLGNDVLAGNGGFDTFVFDEALGSDNIDNIADFVVGDDTIELDLAIFTAISGGALAASAFHIGSEATSADHRIIYDSVAGALFYDADGSGSGEQVQFARIGTGLSLTSDAFTLASAQAPVASAVGEKLPEMLGADPLMI